MAKNITVKNYRIEPFEGKNFSNWSFRVKLILEENELDEFILEPAQKNNAAWKKKDAKCRSLIISFISDDCLELVKDCKSAYEMWRKLKDKYEKRHMGNRLLLRKKLLTLKYNETTDLKNFFLEFDKLVRSLKENGATLSEEELVIQLLLSMPESYDNAITTIENMFIEQLNLELAKHLLLSEEFVRKEEELKKETESFEETVFSTKICYKCNRKGHIRRNCRAPPQNQNEAKEGVNEEIALSKSTGDNKNCESLEKTNQRELLIDLLTCGDLECLVCCESIHENSSVWNCSNCYHVLHLKCTTNWAKSSKSHVGWRCPVCQNVTSSVPYEYYCFCGKTKDPKWNRYDLPHSCGKICGKTQRKSCPHKCMLPCHPGPCPPCKATITKACGCQRTNKTIQCCSDEMVVCNNVCGKELDCFIHFCRRKCHVGSCEECQKSDCQFVV